MMFSRSLSVVVIGLICGSAYAADTDQRALERNVNQQERIEKGLDTGQLSTREAGQLERTESRIDHMEAHALKDGDVTKTEAARIEQAQDRASRQIYVQKHDAQKGNPDSVSSKRLQADVQRNANQQERIAQGVKSGELNAHETARLERGQARTTRREANAAADGHVGAAEQAKVKHTENVNSHRIHRQKHDAQ